MVEYAEQGVLCYAVHPGGGERRRARNMPKQTRSGTLMLFWRRGSFENVAVAWADWQCVWCMGLKDTPELAADAMVFCRRRRGSGWVTN